MENVPRDIHIKIMNETTAWGVYWLQRCLRAEDRLRHIRSSLGITGDIDFTSIPEPVITTKLED